MVHRFPLPSIPPLFQGMIVLRNYKLGKYPGAEKAPSFFGYGQAPVTLLFGNLNLIGQGWKINSGNLPSLVMIMLKSIYWFQSADKDSLYMKSVTDTTYGVQIRKIGNMDTIFFLNSQLGNKNIVFRLFSFPNSQNSIALNLHNHL